MILNNINTQKKKLIITNHFSARHQQEVESLRKFMQEWQRTREEIGKLISVSKSEFGAQIEAVKSGKQLSHLPVIEVAKPPPPPKAAPTQPPPIELPAHNAFQVNYLFDYFEALSKSHCFLCILKVLAKDC